MKLLIAAAGIALIPVSAFATDIARPVPPPVPIAVAPAGLIGGLLLEGWGGAAFIGEASGNASDPAHTSIGDFAGTARWGTPLSADHSLQIDATGEWTTNGDDQGNYGDSWVVGAHWDKRDPNSNLLGVFGGFSGAHSEAEPVQSWFVGVERQTYNGNWTHQIQGGYFTSNNHDASIYNVGFVRVLYRYFTSATSSIQGELSIGYGQQDSVQHQGVVGGWGLRWDKQLHDAGPWDVFVAYRGGLGASFGDSNDDGRIVDHTVLGGVRLTLHGAPDLLTNDRRGVNLDLPDFGRWSGAGELVD